MDSKSKTISIRLNKDEYNLLSKNSNDQAYPILITFTPDGPIDISVPNFPGITYYGGNLQEGLTMIREDLQEELLTCIFSPQPIPATQIPVGENQQVLMITAGA